MDKCGGVSGMEVRNCGSAQVHRFGREEEEA
jgi:hypothetical protein